MSVTLRIFLIVVGCIGFYSVMMSMLKRKITEKQSIIWFISSVLLVLFGIFPQISVLISKVFGVDYAPSVIFMLAILILIIEVFRCYSSNAELKHKLNELAIQVTLLNQERDEELRKKDPEKYKEKVHDMQLYSVKSYKSKKILFVINTLGKAGAEVAMIELMRKLVKEKAEVYLYVMIPMGEMCEAIPEGVRVINKHIDDCSVLSAKGKKKLMKYTLKCFFSGLTGFRQIPYLIRNFAAQKKNGRFQSDKLFWRLISETAQKSSIEYDLAIAYLEGASTYYVADNVKAKKKAAFVHIDYKESGYLPCMDKDCYEKMDKIFTVSKQVKETFCDVYPQYENKTDLFYNIINADLIKEKSNEQGFNDDFNGTRLVTVGRLHYQKGYDLAIESCEKLVKDGYNVRWYILGEGPERGKLTSLIKEKGLQNTFILMGAQKNPYPFVKQADIYVHATRFEGKSIAIEEAQVLGKPIAASDCTGNREQITDGYNGLIFELTAENTANAIEKLIDSPELREKFSLNNSSIEWDGSKDIAKLKDLLGERE